MVSFKGFKPAPARSYSIIISLSVLVIVFLAFLLGEHVEFRHPAMSYLVSALIIALATFFIIRFFFIRFVERNIRPVFKTLESYTMSSRKLRDTIDKGDVVEDLNREVKIWAEDKSEEIRKLRDTEKYRKDFLGNVSHELKTPIFNIQGYLLTLLDGGLDDPDINKLYLNRAEKSVNRLISILEDLDSIALLESGDFQLRIEDFNLVKLVEEVIEDHEMPARQRNIKIGFDRSYNKGVKVSADKKRIAEVMNNLVNNSIKYRREGGRTTIGFRDQGEHILVDISDNGIGIDEKNLPRVFERFYRVDKSRSRESGGTGLGLSIVKHTIQAHNQTITLRSRVDEGTTFIFSLPASRPRP